LHGGGMKKGVAYCPGLESNSSSQSSIP
jgi:hypothetical protein